MWSSAASTAAMMDASSPLIFCLRLSNHRLAALVQSKWLFHESEETTQVGTE
jgi:hypothetical protein